MDDLDPDAFRKFQRYVAFELIETQAMISALTTLVSYDLTHRLKFDPAELQATIRENIKAYRATYQAAAQTFSVRPDVDETDSENN